MANRKVFTLEGKGLKLNTKADLDAHVAELEGSDDFEEVRLLGNTIGVEASQALASLLEKQKRLQVPSD
jgi:Ran GTPase-activating protein 1